MSELQWQAAKEGDCYVMFQLPRVRAQFKIL